MVDQGSLYRNINILFYYHIRHSNIKKYIREIEMNISHAVQGDEMNISNKFLTHYINGILFCALNILAHVICTFQLKSL